MTETLITAMTIGSVGMVCGITLAVAARFFAVHENPQIEEASDLLPGANCGGCGFAGCADYAKAVVVDGAKINLCAPGGAEVIDDLAKLLGKAAEAHERKIALVLCNGDSNQSPRRAAYNGIADCTAAHAVNGGDKACAFGCLGYGSCSRACPVGAIQITGNNLAVVHPELCIGCGACVRTCPRNLIKMVPESGRMHVLCSSPAKGPEVKKACKVGCIGCTMCVKNCGNESIVMEGRLAVVDYTKPPADGIVIEKCPMNTIVERNMTGASDELGTLEVAA